MPLTEEEITKTIREELLEAGRRHRSGQITVTIDLNEGNIARASINTGRAIKAQPMSHGERKAVMG